jgi:hypothetical protein
LRLGAREAFDLANDMRDGTLVGEHTLAARHHAQRGNEAARSLSAVQIAMRAGAEGREQQSLVELMGEDDDAYRWVGAAQPPDEVEAVLTPEHDIEHHDIGRALRDPGKQVSAAADLRDDMDAALSGKRGA